MKTSHIDKLTGAGRTCTVSVTVRPGTQHGGGAARMRTVPLKMNSRFPHCGSHARRSRVSCVARRVPRVACLRGVVSSVRAVGACERRCAPPGPRGLGRRRPASGRGMARRAARARADPLQPWPTCRPPSSSPLNFTSSTMSISFREGELYMSFTCHCVTISCILCSLAVWRTCPTRCGDIKYLIYVLVYK